MNLSWVELQLLEIEKGVHKITADKLLYIDATQLIDLMNKKMQVCNNPIQLQVIQKYIEDS